LNENEKRHDMNDKRKRTSRTEMKVQETKGEYNTLILKEEEEDAYQSHVHSSHVTFTEQARVMGKRRGSGGL
jgi:hypothetical protein